jgi:hypothetical protein
MAAAELCAQMPLCALQAFPPEAQFAQHQNRPSFINSLRAELKRVFLLPLDGMIDRLSQGKK